MLTGGFNGQEGERLIDTFSYQHEFHSINKLQKCYKNSNNQSNIDLILTYYSKSFFKMDTMFAKSI